MIKQNQKNQYIINSKIRDYQLMVIDDNGQKLGIMNRDEALNLANSKNLDLVLIHQSNNPNQPSTAKILDYGKFLYEQNRKSKQSKKNQSITKVKEIKVRPQVSDHDLGWMVTNALKWLDDNCQIKFKIVAYGRMGTKKEMINELYEKFVNLVSTKGKVMSPLKQLSPVLYESIIVKK